MKFTTTIFWRMGSAALVLALFSVGCGSESPQDVSESIAAVDDATSSENNGVGAGEPAAESQDAQQDEEEPESAGGDDADGSQVTAVELAEPDWEGLVKHQLPAMGGISLGVPEDLVVHYDGDMVNVRTAFSFDTGRYDPTLVVARVHQAAPGSPLDVESFVTTAIAGVGTAEATNTTLSVLGENLEGYRFTIGEDQPVGPHYLYSAYPAGAGGPSNWQPFPLGEIYVADVPGGVLAVGYTGQDDESLAIARTIFERVVPTIELAVPLDSIEAPVAPLPLSPPAEPPAPVEIAEGSPPVLDALSTPIDAGTYTTAGFGTPFSFTVDDGWWVQPNFPSWLVLSADASFGPGDRAIVIRSGVESLVPAIRSGGAGDAHPPIPFDLREFAENPPPNLVISGAAETTVGGAGAFTATLTFSDSSDCIEPEICEYMLATRYPFPPSSLRTGYHYEVWQIDEGVVEPIVILSETPDASWLAEARTMIDSIEFLDTTG